MLLAGFAPVVPIVNFVSTSKQDYHLCPKTPITQLSLQNPLFYFHCSSVACFSYPNVTPAVERVEAITIPGGHLRISCPGRPAV